MDFCDDNTIRVEGPPEDVEKAKKEITQQANLLISSTGFAEISVDAKYHKHIIGKGGSTGMSRETFYSSARPFLACQVTKH